MYQIALTSNGPLSGKTTLAKYLQQHHGFMHVSHSETLVREFVRDWNASAMSAVRPVTPLTVEEVYKNKEHWRLLLQSFGYERGFNDPQRMSAWVYMTLLPWLSNQPPRPSVVFEPVRGESQSQVLRDRGFTIVQLTIEESVRRQRAEAIGKDYRQVYAAMQMRPELEMGIAQPDLVFSGEAPVIAIAESLLGLLAERERGT